MPLQVDLADLEPLDEDLSSCPYYRYYHGWGPQATCYQLSTCEHAMGNPEPMCVTCEPSEGWPAVAFAEACVWILTWGYVPPTQGEAA